MILRKNAGMYAAQRMPERRADISGSCRLPMQRNSGKPTHTGAPQRKIRGKGGVQLDGNGSLCVLYNKEKYGGIRPAGRIGPPAERGFNMQINKHVSGATLTLEIEGRIDTTTAPALEGELKHSVTSEVQNLILDFAKVEYISSAGLRVLLAAQKVMKKQGSMVVKNVNEVIMEVFDVTGFSDILTIA